MREQVRAFRSKLKGWDTSIVVAVVIWIVLRSYLIEAFRIPSASMENTLLVGDFLFVNKAIYGGALEIPFTGLRFLRVPGLIGEGGDTLQMVHDTVYRNSRRLDEPYALHLLEQSREPDFRLAQIRAWQLAHYVGRDAGRYHPTTHDWGPVVVSAGHYFVMGDNRDESYDSRFWGFLPRSHIVGKPVIIYFSIATDPLRIRWNRILRRPK